LFFPTEEESFNVDELIVKLSCLENVKVEKMQGKHCFADKFSNNYNRESALRATREVLLFAKQQFKKF
jgi:dienelactone hydrolase